MRVSCWMAGNATSFKWKTRTIGTNWYVGHINRMSGMQRPFDYVYLVYLHSNCKHNVVHVLYLDIFVFYVTGAHVHVR